MGCGASFVAPANFVGNVSGSAVTLSWAAVPGATGHVIDAGSAAGTSDLGRIPLATTSLSATVPAGVGPATSDGLGQFKMRRSDCQQRARLGLKN